MGSSLWIGNSSVTERLTTTGYVTTQFACTSGIYYIAWLYNRCSQVWQYHSGAQSRPYYSSKSQIRPKASGLITMLTP
jgi:hypothetical protein